MKKIIICVIMAIIFNSCTSQTKEQQMEEIINKTLLSIEEYSYNPVYSIQVNKSGCKLIIEIENSIDYRFTENNGESMMMPLNPMLIKKGKQKAIIKVFPKEGDSLLTKYAYINLTFYYAPDKDSSLKEYLKIVTYQLPEDLASKKIPYYESMIEFDVDIPYAYSKDLNKAKNLYEVQNIEEKIIRKYNELRIICKNLDKLSYLREQSHMISRVSNTMYIEKNIKNVTQKYKENEFGVVNSIVKKRELLPVENYDVQYYAEGKIVALWQKNLNPLLYLKGEITNNEGVVRVFEGGDPIFLYWPEDSDELKVW
ncbi:hypothetical protein A8C32_11945 [Flavivirga aquatica]|uniref:Uncharacterized protein n=1 Tax=Flavivirga aquatica TaxID=1849968 RepID=A0A1E5TDG6_9FLAO|nr:hypothetical protein [Flavivirga aquatica]OEK09423.1 hypothetical protein A8C32_11945 [Flavivirga aquatica]